MAAHEHDKALLSDNFSGALQNCRRARRYIFIRFGLHG
jgi:hypothetical protein